MSTRVRYNSTNPTIGLRYKPVSGLMLRASYGTAFLPPSFAQLAPNPTINPAAVVDPRRGGTTSTAQITTGGNPNLRPEKSKSWNVGLVFEPPALTGLRLALDWYQIEKTNQITTLLFQTVANNESYLPGRITRGPVPAGDPYGVGPITAVDASMLNLTKSNLEGVDVTLEYRHDAGEVGVFDFYLVGTRAQHDRIQSTLNAPYVDYVGVPSFSSTQTPPLRYKGTATLTWQRRHWTAGWTMEYFDSYFQNGPPFAVATTFIQAMGGATTVPSQIYQDIFAGYKWSRLETKGDRWAGRLLQGLELQVGLKNVFNRAPPFDPFYSQAVYASPFGNPRLRTWWISLRREF